VGKLDAAQAKKAVLQLLAVFKVQQGQYEMGHTKVFFRPGGWLGWEEVLGRRNQQWLLNALVPIAGGAFAWIQSILRLALANDTHPWVVDHPAATMHPSRHALQSITPAVMS
jgi:hypothetical protein